VLQPLQVPEVPLVIEDSPEGLSKTSKAVAILKKVRLVPAFQ